MQHASMARNTVFPVSHHVAEAAASSPWREHHHPEPEEEPEERQIAVDPFSLRQFSRLNIDGPLPIPSVSVEHHHHRVPHPHPAALFAGASVVPCSAATSPPRLSAAVALNEPLAPPTRRDAHLLAPAPALRAASSAALPRSKSFAGVEAEMDDDEFDVILSASERKASAPQRWGSDVPLIAAGDGAVAGAHGKNGGRGRNAKRHGGAPPFTCCLYLPGLAMRTTAKAPVPDTSVVRPPSLSSPPTFRSGVVGYDPGTARPSTMSLAVELERFECGSTSSFSGLDLDGEASSSYFDLPLELVLACDGDDESDLPVHAAFMFDSDGIRKSVLKKGVHRAAARPSVGRMSTEGSDRISGRHARFSLTSGSAPTSTPS